MKKKLLQLIAVVGVLVLMPATTFAHSNSHYNNEHEHHHKTEHSRKPEHSRKTEVSGTISFNSKHVSKGVPVTVSCNGYSQSTKTNKQGEYSVTFGKGQCGPADTITVTATVKGVTGTSTGKATTEKCHFNVAVINVDVPEYGLLGVIGAGSLGLGTVMIIRRRQLNGHQV